MANLAAVVTAREEVPFEQRGRAVVYMTGQVHHSMHKALRIAGMGGSVFREVSVDRQFRMDPEALAGQVQSDRADGLRFPGCWSPPRAPPIRAVSTH